MKIAWTTSKGTQKRTLAETLPLKHTFRHTQPKGEAIFVMKANQTEIQHVKVKLISVKM